MVRKEDDTFNFVFLLFFYCFYLYYLYSCYFLWLVYLLIFYYLYINDFFYYLYTYDFCICIFINVLFVYLLFSERSLRSESKPLFGALATRQDDCLSALVKFAAVSNQVIQQHVIKKHCVNLFSGK